MEKHRTVCREKVWKEIRFSVLIEKYPGEIFLTYE
jgi:hypothetical protein